MPKKKKKTYSVDIQVTEEFTYQVEASSQEEAEEIAMEQYQADDTPEHTDIVGDPTVTNCEVV